MLSLIVALPPDGQLSTGLTYALSHNAAPPLVKSSADNGGTTASALQVAHGVGSLSQLPKCDEVVAVIPARLLSWHKVLLPKVPKARWRVALEGALEERLLEEPRSLHFALEPGPRPGSQVWVCACNAAWLRSALESFEAAGRPVSRIVPEHAPLPPGSDPYLCVKGDLEKPWVTHVGEAGVQTLPLGRPALGVFGLLHDLGSEPVQFEGKVFTAPQVTETSDAFLGCRSEVRSTPNALIAAAQTPWNIAQFAFESTHGTRFIQKLAQRLGQLSRSTALRPARWGLITLFAVQLTALNAWAVKERSALREKQTEMSALMTRAFPAAKVLVDPHAQLEREVTALRKAVGAVSPGDLEPLLAHVALHAGTGMAPTSISFSPGELRLKGLSVDGPGSVGLTQGLADAGYAARVVGSEWIISVRAKASKTGLGAGAVRG